MGAAARICPAGAWLRGCIPLERSSIGPGAHQMWWGRWMELVEWWRGAIGMCCGGQSWCEGGRGDGRGGPVTRWLLCSQAKHPASLRAASPSLQGTDGQGLEGSLRELLWYRLEQAVGHPRSTTTGRWLGGAARPNRPRPDQPINGCKMTGVSSRSRLWLGWPQRSPRPCIPVEEAGGGLPPPSA